MRKYYLILCVAMLPIFGCRHKKNIGAENMPVKVEVAMSQTETLPTRRTYIGTVAANYEAIIQARVAGFLTSKHFGSGMPVRKGQLIFTIDPSQLQTQVLSARAAVESARAQEVEARNNYERAIPLAEINAISQTQLDQYTAQYAAAQSSTKSAEQTLRNARIELGYTNVYASISGIVTYTNAQVGEYVGPSSQYSTLTTIHNIDTVSVDVAIPMAEYLQYSGHKEFSYDNGDFLSDTELFISDGTRYEYDGKYNYTKANVSNTTGTIIIVVNFPNPKYLLKVGQFARVTTSLGRSLPRVTVPQAAVSQVQNINSVWVVDADSTARYRRVVLGDTYGERWAVDEGVEPNRMVVVGGQMKLHDGQKVIPQKM